MNGTAPSGGHVESWHAIPAAQVLERLGSHRVGLSAAEAGRRLGADGPNVIEAPGRTTLLRIFLNQFQSLIVWVLVVAALISGFLGEAMDAAAILSIVVLNAVFGLYQEASAERSIEALRKMAAPQAKVLRDGRVTVLPAADVVAGDMLALEAGDLVAADARIVEAVALACVESALTGESVPANKGVDVLDSGEVALGDRRNMVFMGTSVAAGTARAVVTATGMSTELGRIAGLIGSVEEPTPLQRKLDAFGRFLIWATLGIVAALFALGFLRGLPLFDLFLGAVSLAVAAVPEGLPAVVTVALALGVSRMARRRALVRNLPAVETLGATTVICTDKTGTLTAGEMTVRTLFVAGQEFGVTGEGYAPEGDITAHGTVPDAGQREALDALATVLIGCNNARLELRDGAWTVIGDPTEGALLAAGVKAGGDLEELDARMPRLAEIPFDSERKRRSVVRRLPDGRLRVLVNGAPDVLLERCTYVLAHDGVRPMTDDDRRDIAARNAAMAGRALRVLGSAWRDLEEGGETVLPSATGVTGKGVPVASEPDADGLERDLVFAGLSGMCDPPRSEAAEAVRKCRSAGIRVVMITGDHLHTAAAVARELGIACEEGDAVSGRELDAMDDALLRRRVARITVYARVTAEHKLRIVRAWKENGAVVAMTGDGVNDAPAVKGADIGVAMGRSGTEVTRQASDMIITDDNFASIVDAVEEGRGIFDNIRKTLQYLLAGNTGEILLMTACVVVGLPIPLLPIHLLWINLVTDGLPALCLATDPIDPAVMARRPMPRSASIADRGFLAATLLTGVLTGGVAFTAFLLGLQTGSLEVARSWAFTVLVFEELLRAFSARSTTRPLWRMELLANRSLILVVVMTLCLQIFILHTEAVGRFLSTAHVSFAECLLLLALAVVPLAVLETCKVVRGAVVTWRGEGRRQG